MIKVRIDNRLHVRKSDLPVGHEAAIKQRLTIPNGARAKAIKLRQWGAEDMPEAFYLYADAGPFLILPRGYAAELRAGLQLAGHDVAWDDQTSAPSLSLHESIAGSPILRPEQEVACQAILRNRQGVLEAPTSAGKTVVVLEAWRRTGLRGLILVEKAGLAKQWRERAREHLGIETGMIGEGEWDEKPLTIAMMQTLYRREIGEDWFRRWGFTACDEAHHIGSASTYNELVKRICSRYLVGVTATPLGGQWEQPFLTHVLGPIFHITTPETLRKAGLRVTPLVKRVHTGWSWTPASAREENLVDTKTIYRYVIKALESDQDRIDLIARTIIAQPPRCAQLVVSKRLGYLGSLRTALERLGYQGDIYMMRGEESGDRRTEIARLADGGDCVILATVADEGVDIPRLDRLHMVWAQRKELTITQQIGRVLRTHPEKREVVVFDYVDDEGMLMSQARARAMVYRRAGYAIEESRDMQRSLT
jgi:superfamily II DNA or RNA helicase